MGLFNKKEQKNDHYTHFSTWLDHVLNQELPEGIIAFNFNIYEGLKNTYDIQLIGSDEFDEDDDDWACSDYFSTDENLCSIPRSSDIDDWEDGLKHVVFLINQYLEKGRFRDILKSVKVISTGFVDGELVIIQQKF